MKIRPGKSEQGNILLICLLITTGVGVVLYSYLSLGSSHENFTARSQAWNMALPVAEAGIEEALAHINYTHAKNMDACGWTKKHGDYLKTRTLTTESYYSAAIEGNAKKITVTGYVRAPGRTNYIGRTITANVAATNAIFTKSIIGKKHIRLGKGSLVDAYDSTDPAYSTGGLYDPTKHKDSAQLASSSTKDNAIRIDKTKVYGSAETSSGGSVDFKNSGTVGDLTWVSSGHLGAQSGHLDDHFNFDYPQVEVPWTGTAATPSGGTDGGDDYQYILKTGNWQLGAVTLSKPMLVKGTAVLYVTGDFKANENIVLEPGATLILYMAGHKFEVADRSIVNTGGATQFQYYGLDTNKEIRIKKKGDNALTGAIYAPSAKIMIEGGNDVYGSVVGKCVHLKHDGEFHFDEGLWKGGLAVDIYTITSWSE
jgi:hypothetical protein